jgi:3-deoxy-D-manno-octulosonate 8-phosphate phosphatase (KDO 8-P phosphatase)
MSVPGPDFNRIKAFIFDVDGVLSTDYSPLDKAGEPVRTGNVKDGFALRCAIREGYTVGIITGAHQKRVKRRFRHLGIVLFYENAADKVACLEHFITETGIPLENILYMGDDLPDYPVMKKAGIATCPADAVPEIRKISAYVSEREGGRGCVREVIERVMRAQHTWPDPDSQSIQ